MTRVKNDDGAPEIATGSAAGAALDAAAAKRDGERLVVSRRRWILAASAVLGGSVAVALAGRSTLSQPSPAASAPPPPPAPARVPRFQAKLFSLEQALLVEDLAEHIIPETDSPGALSAGVPAYIEDIVLEVYDEPERRAFLQALDATGAEARAAYGRAFHECRADEREALVARGLEGCAPSFDTGEPWCFFQAFRALCIEGFCQSSLGATRALQYESVPGEYRGCVPLAEIGRAWAT
ncbi:gluconate 2-dehydrogenase subunit 3 family protein [Sorangium sp. So ce861]|uniref:gluconate 2-dehydrogenase subunit 3 family protein n=1 Tax=Sorangium sp. So ce861 TaxID=3133323 RepID=UPI003F5FF8CD